MRTILTFVVVGGLAACSPAGRGPGGQRPSVVASFYPLAYAATEVGGSCVSVDDLTPPGAEPHDLELTPDLVEAIATADLVLYVGGGFQPAVEDAIDEAEGRTVDVLSSVATIGGDAQAGAPAVDPHVWLDPGRFGEIVGTVGKLIGALDVPASCGVADRAERLGKELEDLDGRYGEGLASCRLDVIVTSHAAFGYLADAYGLRQVAIAGLEPSAQPTPDRLAAVADVVEREQVDTIFTEELVSPEVAETLARETGARIEVLATIEGLTTDGEAAGDDYRTLMEDNLDALRSALHCA